MWESIDWMLLLGGTPLEIIATLCAVAGVILIARQNIIGWPLGIIWAGISAWLAFTRWQLVSDGIMYLSAIPVQLYCWWVWMRCGAAAKQGATPFQPGWLSHRSQLLLVVSVCLSILLWGLCISAAASRFAWLPPPALLWRDSTTTVLNYYAQFLQARKRMENWVGWVIVNLLGIHIYWVREAPVYALQYAFFLVLGLYGWFQWHRHCKRSTS